MGNVRELPATTGDEAVNWGRLYDLLNFPWVHVPRWQRAHRLAAIRGRHLADEHIAWAQRLSTRTVAFRNTPRKEGEQQCSIR